MGRFYANENVPAQEVAELRGPGHEVLKHSDAEKANSALPDDEVLASADVSQPTLATLCALLRFLLSTRILADRRIASVSPVWPKTGMTDKLIRVNRSG